MDSVWIVYGRGISAEMGKKPQKVTKRDENYQKLTKISNKRSITAKNKQIGKSEIRELKIGITFEMPKPPKR